MDKYTVLEYLFKRKSDADYALHDFVNKLIIEGNEKDNEIKELKGGLMKKKKKVNLIKPVISMEAEMACRVLDL